jgi:chromosome segregation ATPase
VWEFASNSPAEAVALLLGLIGSIGGAVKWLTDRAEKRMAKELETMKASIANTAQLADMLYKSIEGQLERAQATEIELRDRLEQREAEYTAQASALRMIHTKALEMEAELRMCHQQTEVYEQKREQAEHAHAELLRKFQAQRSEIEQMHRQVVSLQFEIQRQSAETERMRQRLARGANQEPDETSPTALTPDDVEERWG